MRCQIPKVVLVLLTSLFAECGSVDASEALMAGRSDYLALVRAYADRMIKDGRDTYGKEHTPLFVEELDRRTMGMLEGKSLQQAAAISYSEWGIRSHDRMLGGANPHHCQNLYQILYALTQITGEKRYSEEADRSLVYFLNHCQSQETGLLCWGEHAGWDLRSERQLDTKAGDTHEFYRPWILWDRCWLLADEACRRFAVGLWEHQIGDHETGDFSRHAKISSHEPDTMAPYARHGGFYIMTWGAAYAHTGDEVFLKAMRSVLDGLERARLHEGGYLTGGSKANGSRCSYDVSLAVSLASTMVHVPSDLAARMREVAVANDEVFARSLDRRAVQSAKGVDRKKLWSNAYGRSTGAGRANVFMLRYRQTQNDAYRRAILQEAERYRTQEIDLSHPVWPGTVGAGIWLMLNAHELTGEEHYLAAAERFARTGVALFLEDGPLPRASHVHDHYEAVTNGDTLMMALLRLWLVQSLPEARIKLTYTDR